MSYDNKIKSSLSFVANKLTELSNLYENDELNSVGEFIDLNGELEGSIDRRKWLVSDCESKISMLNNMQSQVMKELNKYKKIKSSIIENTKVILQYNPDVKFTDSIGRRVYIMKNPSGKMKISKIEPRSLSISNVLSQVDFDYLTYAGYEHYTTDINLKTLDVQKVKEDIIKGKEFDFAILEYGEHIRGLTDKNEQIN